MRALAVLALLLTASPADAESLPRGLGHYMPYATARAIILKAGWTPVAHDKADLFAFDRDTQDWYIRHGYSEVESCAPSGDGTCLSEFKSAGGRSLFVFSTGGAEVDLPPNGEPNFLKACLGHRTVDCR